MSTFNLRSFSLKNLLPNKMKLIVLFALISVAVAVEIIPILKRSDVRGDGGIYENSYLSGDGTAITETGMLVPSADGKGYVLVKKGVIAYTSPEGKAIKLTYVADDKGFRPSGDHLPIAPIA